MALNYHKAESGGNCERPVLNDLGVIEYLWLFGRHSAVDQPLDVVCLLEIHQVLALGNCLWVAVELSHCPFG